MTRLRFKKHRIERTCTKEYKDYHRYKESLQKDFEAIVHTAISMKSGLPLCPLKWTILSHGLTLKRQEGMIWTQITSI